ncbi:MAG: hypothetical protein RIQ70_42, partial [Bacteroidota bacterium]
IYSMLLVSVLSLMLLSACSKKGSNKNSEKYRCTVHNNSWMMGTVSHDTTYIDTIEVKREGDFITLLDNSFLIDSIWKGTKFKEGNVHDHREIQFIHDSIYFSTYSGGLGGGGGTSYAGIKID